MKRIIWGCFALPVLAALLFNLDVEPSAQRAAAQDRQMPRQEAPTFQVDPSWPKIPNHWVFGEVSSVSVDAQDHVWVLQRPRTVRPEQKASSAPAVLEFAADGTFLQAWGGPGEGYEWPENEHGIFLDYKGLVWIGGNDEKDDQLLKFTQAGKFVMQIGRSGQSKGNKDTKNLHRPADAYVYPKTNEVFVADGYGNRRVIVFDADTGAFKRMWGAFGNEPTDPEPRPAAPAEAAPRPVAPEEGPGPQQFNLVHAARVSNDGLVYISDRGNKRVQVFTLEGKYMTQVFIGRECQAPQCGNGQTAASTAFSVDPQQRYLIVANRSQARVMVFDRKKLAFLYSFGHPGASPGDFNILHHMAADSKGNLYTTEVNDGFHAGECCRRIQKFVFQGISHPQAK